MACAVYALFAFVDLKIKRYNVVDVSTFYYFCVL